MVNVEDDYNKILRERAELERRVEQALHLCRRGSIMIPAVLVERALKGER